MNKLWIAVAAGVLTLAAGCAANDGPRDYSARDERVIDRVSYGTVQSVRAVRVEENDAPVGTIAGAALGGILGNQVGHGSGRAAATILGAVGGGLAGNAIEHQVTEHDAQEIVVRLDDGSTIAVTQGGRAELRPGDRVQVLGGSGGARIERL